MAKITRAKLTQKVHAILQTVMRAPFTKEENERFERIQKHSDTHPHWSTEITDWPANRWDSISSAPMHGKIIPIRIRVRHVHKQYNRQGKLVDVESFSVHDKAHYAYDLSGEYQPPFRGWYTEDREPIVGDVVDWQPQHA